MSIAYLNPVADCLVPVNTYNLSVDLSGKATIGLVVNKIVDCDRLMDAIGETLAELHPELEVRTYPTGRITFADAELMDRVAAECDAAICAIGHCGSCTAGTVKDGVALIERGCPSVTLVTEVFWDMGDNLARSLGWPDAPRVQLPYPVWGSAPDAMSRVAEQAARQALSKLESGG